jgi:NhaC family Na+:H+ antiporter
MMTSEAPLPKPSFMNALITFGLIVVVISYGLFFLKVNLHSLMLICLMIAGISASLLTRCDFSTIRHAMSEGVSRALGAIFVFILIGVLIAAFIQAGTVSALIYYGLQFLTPSMLLPAGLILCSLMSVATGTSWGTAGTAGVVLVGVGGAMNIPLPLVAGVVVSGACFGDKISPLSDTTILAAISSRTDLYDHIRSMMYTTGPAFLIVLLVFWLLGQQYAGNALPSSQLLLMSNALNNAYIINAWCLLPFLVMLGLSIARVAAEPAMLLSSVIAVLIAVFMQDAEIVNVLTALYSGGGPGQTGVAMLDELLGRGGIAAMMWTLSLGLMALSLGGILYKFGFLQVLITTALRRVTSVFNLVVVTILSVFAGNLTMGEAYLSITLGGQLFSDAYDERGVNRSVLSRSLEEGGTLTAPLIPWTTGGAFMSATLGVSVLDYAPWALLNWLNPLLGMLFAFFGIAIFKPQAAPSANHSTPTDVSFKSVN